jgi:hypothetical protein
MPHSRAANRAAIWYAGWAKQILIWSFGGSIGYPTTTPAEISASTSIVP